MLSIIIPILNEEECLPQLFESLKNLDWPRHDYEVIVVDNNSRDKTFELVQKLGADIVVKEPTRGSTWARQRGTKAANGEIFCFADADCQIPKDWLKRINDFLSKDDVIAVSGTCNYGFGGLKGLISEFIQTVIYPMVPKILGFIFRRPAALLIGGNFAVKREFFEKTGGFNLSIKFWGEDADMAMKLAKVGKVVFTPKLEIKTSARRFQKEGLIKTSLKYFLNYLWFYFFNKPFVKE